jgi:hypothetical protein
MSTSARRRLLRDFKRYVEIIFICFHNHEGAIDAAKALKVSHYTDSWNSAMKRNELFVPTVPPTQ